MEIGQGFPSLEVHRNRPTVLLKLHEYNHFRDSVLWDVEMEPGKNYYNSIDTTELTSYGL